MRILLNVKLPHQPFNAAVKNGTAGSKLSRILEAIKPEAVYFTEQNGQRGAVLIVDLPDPSKIPALAEPWFLTFEADVAVPESDLHRWTARHFHLQIKKTGRANHDPMVMTRNF